MECLPYIDEHRRVVAAPPERVWTAIAAAVRAQTRGATAEPLARLLGSRPAAACGDLGRPDVRPGQAVPGFEVAEADAPHRLALRGSHRFSRYALTFELERDGARGTVVRARTHAAFPGRSGRLYRAVVIGSRAHVLAVHRILRDVDRRARTGA